MTSSSVFNVPSPVPLFPSNHAAIIGDSKQLSFGRRGTAEMGEILQVAEAVKTSPKRLLTIPSYVIKIFFSTWNPH